MSIQKLSKFNCLPLSDMLLIVLPRSRIIIMVKLCPIMAVDLLILRLLIICALSTVDCACVQETQTSTELRHHSPPDNLLLPVSYVTWSTRLRHFRLIDTVTSTQSPDHMIAMMMMMMKIITTRWCHSAAVTTTTTTTPWEIIMIQRQWNRVDMAQHLTSGHLSHRHHHHHHHHRCHGRRTVTSTPVSERAIHVSRTSQGHCRRRPVRDHCSETWQCLVLDVRTSINDDQSSHHRRQLHVDVTMSTMRHLITPHTTHFTLSYCSSTLSLSPFCSLLRMSFDHFRF